MISNVEIYEDCVIIVGSKPNDCVVISTLKDVERVLKACSDFLTIRGDVKDEY